MNHSPHYTPTGCQSGADPTMPEWQDMQTGGWNAMGTMNTAGSMNATGSMNGMNASTAGADLGTPVLRIPNDMAGGSVAGLPGLYGSMQEALADNLGLYAVCEFVVGTQDMAMKQGILYSVGRSFIVLYDEQQQNFILCDIFSIKFVTLYMPGHRPWNLIRTPQVPMVNVPGVGTVPAGNFGIGTGQVPHLLNSPAGQR